MKLSIIMPVYNKESYLDEICRRVCDWEYQDFEFIIINDGSTDGSLNILQKYKERDARISLFSTENCGASAARNCGLYAARGDWIWFIDADDEPNMAFPEECFRMMEDYKFDIFMGDFVKKYADGSEQQIYGFKDGIVSDSRLPDLFVQSQLSDGYFGYLWNKIIRKNLIEQAVARFHVGLTLAEDLDFMLGLYMKTESVYMSHTIAMNYRVDALNSSGDKKIDYWAQLKIQLKTYKWFQAKGKDYQYHNFLAMNITRYAAFVIYYENEEGNDVEQAAEKLLSCPAVRENLTDWDDESVMGRIAWLLRKNDIGKLVLYLKVRGFLRRGYRLYRMKNGGRV